MFKILQSTLDIKPIVILSTTIIGYSKNLFILSPFYSSTPSKSLCLIVYKFTLYSHTHNITYIILCSAVIECLNYEYYIGIGTGN